MPFFGMDHILLVLNIFVANQTQYMPTIFAQLLTIGRLQDHLLFRRCVVAGSLDRRLQIRPEGQRVHKPAVNQLTLFDLFSAIVFIVFILAFLFLDFALNFV